MLGAPWSIPVGPVRVLGTPEDAGHLILRETPKATRLIIPTYSVV